MTQQKQTEQRSDEVSYDLIVMDRSSSRVSLT